MSNYWLGFCFSFQPKAWDEDGERPRLIESRVFSGLKVSIQSLLKQSPWEPINLSAAAISIRRGHTLASSLTHMHAQCSIYSLLQSGRCLVSAL